MIAYSGKCTLPVPIQIVGQTHYKIRRHWFYRTTPESRESNFATEKGRFERTDGPLQTPIPDKNRNVDANRWALGFLRRRFDSDQFQPGSASIFRRSDVWSAPPPWLQSAPSGSLNSGVGASANIEVSLGGASDASEIKGAAI
jgi:hypothetical protein